MYYMKEKNFQEKKKISTAMIVWRAFRSKQKAFSINIMFSTILLY